LALNIDTNSNLPDIDLARSVGVYFRLGEKGMDNILDEVRSSILNWTKIVAEFGVPRNEQTLMADAFKV
jgi:serine/threonine-protein kinase HipA